PAYHGASPIAPPRRTVMPALDEFADIVKPNERLAPYMHLRLGGPAEFLVQPRSRQELSAVVRRCFQQRLPLRVLGGGCEVQVRERDELRFGYHWSNLDDPVILSAEFRLESDAPDAIVKRMRRAWILRKASQPLSYQPACRVFRNPRALSAAALIEQAGLAHTRVGGAEVSERDSNYVVIHPDASARDVLRLIDLMRSRVQERFNVELELEVTIW